MTAAAPPSATTLQKMQQQGFDVTHVYGLTETYGPAVICSWDPDWSNMTLQEQGVLRARQGVNYHALEDLQVSLRLYAWCVCIYMYICMYIYIYMCVCIYIYMHKRMQTRVCQGMNYHAFEDCGYECVCMHVFI
jgi:hypothetical protein